MSTSVTMEAVPARLLWLIRSIQDQTDFADFCWWLPVAANLVVFESNEPTRRPTESVHHRE